MDDSKPKAQRKAFVVGGTTKNHRVPSYGKKLNQLGKLTALTTSENKINGPDNEVSENQRRTSVHRSTSQKSLHDSKNIKKSSSSQEIARLRRSSSHHASNNKLANLRSAHRSDNNDDSRSDEVKAKNPGEIKAQRAASKRPTFVIEDDQDDEEFEDQDCDGNNSREKGGDSAIPWIEAKDNVAKVSTDTTPGAHEDVEDVASSFAHDAFRHEVEQQHRSLQMQSSRKENEDSVVSPTDLLSPRPKSLQQAQLRVGLKPQPVYEQTKEDRTADAETQSIKGTVTTTDNQSVRRRPSSGLLFNSSGSLAGPQVTKASAVSKDIQIKDHVSKVNAENSISSTSFPTNSQPMTSKFLESPRRPPSTATNGVSRVPEIVKDNGSASNAIPSVTAIHTVSPRASTSNLGGGSSRTQQKLLLQRASSMYGLDKPADSGEEGLKSALLNPARALKELERISKEYANVKRFRSPQSELATRLYSKGIAVPPKTVIRRTMTQTSLAHGSSDGNKLPGKSSSSASLGHKPGGMSLESIQSILEQMWHENDAQAED